MDQLAALNPEQRDAVLHIDGPLLILAGAGSGKTRVIAQRIAYLISEGFAQPDEILAVTFTNKAAEELRTRVETLLGNASMTGSWMSTFHSLCARLLRREATAIGLPRDFVIYDSSDQVALIKQVMKDLQIDDSALPPRQALSKDQPRQEHDGRPGVLPELVRLEPARRADGEDLREIHRGAAGQRRARFRRPAPEGRGAARQGAARPGALRREVPLRDGGRIPGHEPAAISPDSAALAAASQSVRRGRSGPVDLSMARRGPAEHPGLRAGLPRGQDRQAGAQLPLHAGDSGRGVGGDQHEPQPQGEAAVDRAQGRRAHQILPRLGRPGRSRLHHARRPTPASPASRTARWPCCTA